MDIKKGKILINKDEKSIIAMNDEKFQIIHFNDNLPDKDKKKVKKIKGKGENNCSIAVGLYKYLKSFHVPTHFKNRLEANEILVNKIDMIPVKIIIWNITSGIFGKKYKVQKGEFLKCPVVEYYLNDEKLNFPMINMDHILAFNYTTDEEFKVMDLYSRKINAVLKSYFERRGFKLGKFDLEFGRWKGSIMLASDITPDSCQFWDMKEKRSRWFYLNKEDISEAYKELTERLL